MKDGSCTTLRSAVAADAPKTDGKAEGQAAAGARYTQDMLDEMDADKNLEVSNNEFLGYMSKEFDRVDVHHDGRLQQSETRNKSILGQQKTSVSHR